MADKRMNDFTPVTDAEYVYGELADGSQGKMRKADFAKLLGGLLDFPIPRYSSKYDMNSVSLNTGIYQISSLTQNNESKISNGILLVFKGSNEGGRPTLQVAYGIEQIAQIRISWLDNWRGWMSIMLT